MDWLFLLALCSIVGCVGFIILKRRESDSQSSDEPLTLAESIREKIKQKEAESEDSPNQ